MYFPFGKKYDGYNVTPHQSYLLHLDIISR